MKLLKSLLYFTHWLVRRKHLVGVYVVLIKDEHVLVVKKRLGVVLGWQIPGGGLGRDRDAYKQAKKELLEETGVRATKLRLVGIRGNKDRRDIHVVFWASEFEIDGEPCPCSLLEIKEARFVLIKDALRSLLQEDSREILRIALDETGYWDVYH